MVQTIARAVVSAAADNTVHSPSLANFSGARQPIMIQRHDDIMRLSDVIFYSV